jgi:hypothetical protein
MVKRRKAFLTKSDEVRPKYCALTLKKQQKCFDQNENNKYASAHHALRDDSSKIFWARQSWGDVAPAAEGNRRGDRGGGEMKRVTSVLVAVLFLLPLAVYAEAGKTWNQLPGFAKDIGVGADGSVWIIGTNPVGPGHNFGIHKWTGNNWVGVDGGGVRIAVDQSGNPWIVNADNEIFRRVDDNWNRLPGSAKDIGVGADGSVWIIGTNPIGTVDNFGIHRWTGSDWVGIEGGGVRIAVDQSGNPWIVNANGEIFQRVDDKWNRLPGFAKDIGVGADGSAWIIGTNRVGTAGNFGIHRWTGNNWVGIEGGGVQISVDHSGLPWIVNSTGNIFRRQ